jgi:tRNA(Ile2) C34 agmatinyltransferase TiaS
VTDETPKPAPVKDVPPAPTDEVIINQGSSTTQPNWPSGKPDPVVGPLALALFLVFVVMGGATFVIMHFHPETASYGFTFLGLLMVALIASYNAYQTYRNGRALHHAVASINEVSRQTTADVVRDVTANVNKVSRETTNDVKEVIKDKAKEGVKELAKEQEPVAVVPISALGQSISDRLVQAKEDKKVPLHHRIFGKGKGHRAS